MFFHTNTNTPKAVTYHAPTVMIGHISVRKISEMLLSLMKSCETMGSREIQHKSAVGDLSPQQMADQMAHAELKLQVRARVKVAYGYSKGHGKGRVG